MIEVNGISTIQNLKTIENVDTILGYSEGFFLVQKSYPIDSKKEIKEQFNLSNNQVNKLLSSQKHNDKYTICWFVNRNDGSVVGPFKNARLFSDGVTIANNNQVAVDTKNKILFKAKDKGLEEIGDFKEDRAVAVIFSENLLENYYVYINKNGNKVHRGRYYKNANNYGEGIAVVEKYGHQCIVYHPGNCIYRTKYYLNDYYSEGLISATDSKTFKTGYVNEKSEIVIDFDYEDGKPFSESLAPVKQNGKWGYINKEGNLVIPCIFDNAFGFINGIAKVERIIDGIVKPAIIDKKGNYVIETNDNYRTIDICDDLIIINNNSYVPIKEMKLENRARLYNGSFETLFLFENREEKNNFIMLANKEIEETEKDIASYKEQVYTELQESIFKLKYKK